MGVAPAVRRPDRRAARRRGRGAGAEPGDGADVGEDDWSRAGRHPEHDSPYTVELWLEIYAEHPYEHADQIRRALEG